MRLDLAARFAALASICAADSLAVCYWCTRDGQTCGGQEAQWYSAYGVYKFDASGGCRTDRITVPGMTEICLDWGLTRGHFFFSSQGKRCIQQSIFLEVDPQLSEFAVWHEVPCTW